MLTVSIPSKQVAIRQTVPTNGKPSFVSLCKTTVRQQWTNRTGEWATHAMYVCNVSIACYRYVFHGLACMPGIAIHHVYVLEYRLLLYCSMLLHASDESVPLACINQYASMPVPVCMPVSHKENWKRRKLKGRKETGRWTWKRATILHYSSGVVQYRYYCNTKYYL